MVEFNAPHPSQPDLDVVVIGLRWHDTKDLLLARTSVTVFNDEENHIVVGDPNDPVDYSV